MDNRISSNYKGQRVQHEIAKALRQEKAVQIRHFLTDETFTKLCEALSKVKWKRAYLPALHSYHEASVPSFWKAMLQDEKVKRFFSEICGRMPKQWKLLKFEEGDYTLLKDRHETYEGVEFIFECTLAWKNIQAGYTSYTVNDKELFRILPATNLLTCVERSREIKSFVKYIPHLDEKQERVFFVGKA